jgi:integrase
MGQIRKRHQNRGLRKICDCPRRTWAKCPHSWHFSFKPKRGSRYRFSVDSEVGKHIASKGDAETLADNWRTEIRAGTFRRSADDQVLTSKDLPSVLTLEKFGETYFERLGKPVSKYIQTTKALFRWAVKKGYLTRNPAGDSEAMKREQNARRDRRLEDGEERNLPEHAGPHLQRLIIGALETGCRKGELLSLTWRDVNVDRREMTIRAERTKTKIGRVIPISARLAGILELAKTDPTGKDLTPEDFVFGDVVGRQVTDVKKAWETGGAEGTRTHADVGSEQFAVSGLTGGLPSSEPDVPRPETRSRIAAAGGGLAASQRGPHARTRQHRADLDVSQRDSGRIAGRHATTRCLPWQVRGKRGRDRAGASEPRGNTRDESSVGKLRR